MIVRPKTPGGQSEVITLDNVSPEFVRALAERQRNPQAPRRPLKTPRRTSEARPAISAPSLFCALRRNHRELRDLS